jgi:hypothetical protein
MSIPSRLWRVIRGHWELAEDRGQEAEAMATAYAELSEQLRAARLRDAAGAGAGASGGVLPQPARPKRGQDPLAVSYELLGVAPGIGLAELDAAYQARVAELDPARHPEGSPQRQVVAGRRQAVEAAYEKLRDLLNPTETRFEKIEF